MRKNCASLSFATHWGHQVNLMVFGPGGTRLAVNSDDPEGIGTDSAIRGLELTEPGKYLFFATDVFFYNAGVGGAMLEYTGGDFTIILSDAK